MTVIQLQDGANSPPYWAGLAHLLFFRGYVFFWAVWGFVLNSLAGLFFCSATLVTKKKKICCSKKVAGNARALQRKKTNYTLLI